MRRVSMALVIGFLLIISFLAIFPSANVAKAEPVNHAVLQLSSHLSPPYTVYEIQVYGTKTALRETTISWFYDLSCGYKSDEEILGITSYKKLGENAGIKIATFTWNHEATWCRHDAGTDHIGRITAVVTDPNGVVTKCVINGSTDQIIPWSACDLAFSKFPGSYENSELEETEPDYSLKKEEPVFEAPPPELTLSESYDDISYPVEVKVDESTTIQGHFFDVENKSFKLKLSGPDGTEGNIEMKIPTALIGGPLTVTLDGNPITFDVDANESHNIVNVNVPHSTHVLTVTGTSVVPEFPVHIFMIMAMVIGIMAFISRSKLLNWKP